MLFITSLLATALVFAHFHDIYANILSVTVLYFCFLSFVLVGCGDV